MIVTEKLNTMYKKIRTILTIRIVTVRNETVLVNGRPMG